MSTEIVLIDANKPDEAVLARAAAVLRAGELVAFPTETVYGLGANALDAAAVGRIFAAKGRPAHNPVIVHVADLEGARALAASWHEEATRLAERFWPGPLTLVVPKNERVPTAVTAGGPTVALRLPAHPVALGLLRACGLPLAAPSANPATELSPTRAEHVLRGLDGRIDLLLDAGPTPGGLESTILDLTVRPPRLLRPGLIGPVELEAVVGPVERPGPEKAAGPLKAPGQLPRHYSPRTPLECLNEQEAERIAEFCDRGKRAGVLTSPGTEFPLGPKVVAIQLPADPAGYAAQLYAALHQLDQAGVERIFVVMPPATEAWLAVHDRLLRASAKT